MVFEALFKARDIEAHPSEMLIYSMISTIVSAIIATIIFDSYASIVFPFLITISLFPVIHRILEDQEEIDEYEYSQKSFFERYENIIRIYFMFFSGVILGIIIIAILMPTSLLQTLFKEQISTLEAIRGENIDITGYAYAPDEEYISLVANNIKVSFIAFIMSFFFGTGAVFILSWNATVIGLFIVIVARELTNMGQNIILGHLNAIASIALHGIPEVLAYFLAGIAGGILSYGIIQGNNKQIIIKDAIMLYVLSIITIVIAGAIEVFIVGVV